MGSYTNLIFKAKLRKDTPDNVISLLKRVLIDHDLGLGDAKIFKTEDVFVPDIDNPFFKCDRWYMLFKSTNWDDTMQGGKFYEDKGYWILDLHTEFKNYENEIGLFVDWISPFVVGRKKKQYVGRWRWENEIEQNIYIERK